jgi:hypothetical protein
MTQERAKLSRGNEVAKAMDYMLKRWPAFTRFLDDGRICLSRVDDWRGDLRWRGISVCRRLSPMPVSQFAP